jgi:sugar phosphate isomerase/epimerase
MFDQLGIERLCCFGAMPPVEFVELAARLGCHYVGIGLNSMNYYNPDGFPPWSLRDDLRLRRELSAALVDNDIVPGLCEGFSVQPGLEADSMAADLDLAAQLGCRCINLNSRERDKSRAVQQFAVVAEMARRRNILVTSEIGMSPLVTLRAGLQLMEQVGSDNFRLLLDSMHFFRMGSSLDDLAANPGAIGYVQLCDAPRVQGAMSYMEEALHERLPPGQGELPLIDLIRRLPPEVIMGLEVPQRSLASVGMAIEQRIGQALQSASNTLRAASVRNVPS